MILITLHSDYRDKIPSRFYEHTLYATDANGAYDIVISLLNMIQNKYPVDLTLKDMLNIGQEVRTSAKRHTPYQCRFFDLDYRYYTAG